MLKIAYGVQGTGNGHITRARIMSKAFSQRDDVKVDFYFSGRDPSRYFDMGCFGHYQTFDGLSFTAKNGKVSQLQTLIQSKPIKLLRDINNIDLRAYDLVLNDFEPITAWAAKQQRIPSISLSHQAAFNQGAPTQGARLTDRLIMRFFAPTDIKLGVHWFHFGRAILPPFIHDKPIEYPNNKQTLVYLPFECVRDISAMLEPLSDHTFICFHPDIKRAQQHEHVEWHPTSIANFKHALQHANGVIANAGFELSSESLQLGKKLLVKPLSGQFEQLSNAYTLRQLELCETMFHLDTDTVEEWLQSEDQEPITFPDNPHLLIDWLTRKKWTDTKLICDQLWKQVIFPDQTRHKLMRLAF